MLLEKLATSSIDIRVVLYHVGALKFAKEVQVAELHVGRNAVEKILSTLFPKGIAP